MLFALFTLLFSLPSFATSEQVMDLYVGTYAAQSQTCAKKQELAKFCGLKELRVEKKTDSEGPYLAFQFVTAEETIPYDAGTRQGVTEKDSVSVSQLVATDYSLRSTTMLRQQTQALMKTITLTPIKNRFRLLVNFHAGVFDMGIEDETWTFVLKKN